MLIRVKSPSNNNEGRLLYSKFKKNALLKTYILGNKIIVQCKNASTTNHECVNSC